MSWDAWNTEPQTEENPTWGDYAKTLGQGTAAIGEGLAGAARYFYEAGKSENGADLSRAIQGAFGKVSADMQESMTPEARQRLQSTLTSDEFWQHPLSSAALKATGMAPMVAAAAIPGGLIGDAITATAVTAAAGGVLNAGSVIDEIYKKTDALSDDELQKQSDFYAGLRATFDEKEARRQYNETLMGLKPAINLVVGAAAGAFGPAAAIVKGAKGAGPGVLAATAEGAAGNAVQGGVADYSVQEAELEGGLKKDFDQKALIDAVLEGGVLGAAGGAVGGAVGKLSKGKAKAEEIKAKQSPEVEVDLNEATAQAPKQSGSGVAKPPVEAAPIGNPDSAPTRSETAYPKAEAAKAKGKGKVKGPTVETVEPAAPSVAEAAAIADFQQPRAPEVQAPEVPAPVAEAAQRVARPPQLEQPPVPAPGVTPEPVAPPEVAEASQRVAPQITPEVTQPQVAPEVRAPEVPAPVSTAPVQVEIAPEPPKAVATPKPVEPVKPATPAQVTPVEEVRQTGRVLRAIKDKAAQEAESKAAKEAFRKANKNAKEVAELEANPEGAPSKGKNWTKAEKEARAASSENAKKIFDEHVPEEARTELLTLLGRGGDRRRREGAPQGGLRGHVRPRRVSARREGSS